MTRWLLLALLLAARPAAAVERVVSLNLCTDQMLVLLAPDKVAGLSVLARDPALSFVAAQAAGMPVARTSAETVLRLRPDLVLAARYGAQTTLSVLEQEGVRVIRVDLPVDWPGVRTMTRDLATLLEEPARGEALLAAMDAILADPPVMPGLTDHGVPAPTDHGIPASMDRGVPGLSRRGTPAPTEHGIPAPAADSIPGLTDRGVPGPTDRGSPGPVAGMARGAVAGMVPGRRPGDEAVGTARNAAHPRTAIALEPRLYLAGPDSILGAAMRAAGLSTATEAPRTTLETLIRHPPDLLVVPVDPGYPSLATDLLDHPALQGIPRRIVPPNLTICPGPFSAQAVALLRS